VIARNRATTSCDRALAVDANSAAPTAWWWRGGGGGATATAAAAAAAITARRDDALGALGRSHGSHALARARLRAIARRRCDRALALAPRARARLLCTHALT